MNKLPQIIRFGIIGSLAASVNFSVVILLVECFKLNPMYANVIAFLIAFQVSYFGHRRWTFSGTAVRHSMAFSKLFFIQSLNLAANEGLFFIFLKYFSLPYPLALILVLMILAAFTFMMSKYWVFRCNRSQLE